MGGLLRPVGPLQKAEKHTLDNDKAFAVYVAVVIGGVCTLWTALTLAGFPTMPPLPTFFEHVLLGLGFRAAYKWGGGGWDWSDWSVFGGDAATEAAATAGLQVPPGAVVD
jgi:hypothetical protein